MSLLKYVERLKRMDDLIGKKATGMPDEFAAKLGICKSMLMINLAELKEMGANVNYDSVRQTYYYRDGCRLNIGFIETTEMTKVRGGETFEWELAHSNNIRMEFVFFV
jgi:hypothetical protein